MAENVGLASIYRQKNPYDRKVETTAAMLPKSGYASPFLAYVMGRDTARAGEWDSERDRKIEEIFNKQAMSEEEKTKAKASLDFMELALKTPATAEGNAQVKEVWENYFKLKTGANFNIDNIRALGEDKNSKEMVIDNGGEKTVIYLTPTGINLVDKESGEVRPFDPKKDGGRFTNAPKAPEPFTLGEGQTRFDASGKPVVSAPAKAKEERLPNTAYLQGPQGDIKAVDKHDIKGVQKLFDTGYKPYKTEDEDLLKDVINFSLEKGFGKNQEFQDWRNKRNTQPAAQAGNPPAAGARQASDGKWYVPDSKRPGKWLLVR